MPALQRLSLKSFFERWKILPCPRRRSGCSVRCLGGNSTLPAFLSDYFSALFRLRGRFRDFEAAPLRTAVVFCSCLDADASRSRLRRSSCSLRSFFSLG